MQDPRCPWCLGDPLYQHYHDTEWGVPCFDDSKLFEFLILEGAQAGLSWLTVLRKRNNYQLAFDNFNPQLIASYTPAKVAKLLTNPGIIRNRLKVESAIKNARACVRILERESSFADYLWQFVDGVPRQNQFRNLQDIPATTPTSDTMSKTLKKDGFNFVGSTICYAHMQATGMVNDHLLSCPRYTEVKSGKITLKEY